MKYPKNKLFEQLADIEHQRWASWQQYVFEKCKRHFDKHLQIVTGKNKEKKIKYENGLKIMTWSWKTN